jgi:hypothetical protein
MVASFGRHSPKTNKEIRDLIIQSSDSTLHLLLNMVTVFLTSAALTRSVKDKIILFLIQINF